MREMDEKAEDSRRLDALLNLDIDVNPADGGGWVLIDWRVNPPRTTEHLTGRDAIDAALLANNVLGSTDLSFSRKP